MPRAQIIGSFFAASFLLSPAVASAAPDAVTPPLITAQKPFVAIKKTDVTDDDKSTTASDDTKTAKDDDADDDQACSFENSFDIGDYAGGDPLSSGASNAASVDCTKGAWEIEIGAKVFAISGSPPNNNDAAASNQYSGTNLTNFSLTYTTQGTNFKIGAFNPDWDPQPNSSLPDYYANAVTAPLAAIAWTTVEGVNVTQTLKSGSTTMTGNVMAGKEVDGQISGPTQGLDYAFSLSEQKGGLNVGIYAYRRAGNADNAPERLVDFTLGYTHHKGRDTIQVRIDGGSDKNADGEVRKYTYALTSLADTHNINQAFSIYAAAIAGKGSRTGFMFNLAGGLKYSPTGDDDKCFTLGLTRGIAQRTTQLSISIHIAG